MATDITAVTNQSSTTDGATALAGIKTALTSINTNKAELASPTFTGTVTSPALILSSETASTIASFDGSKNVKSLALATYPSLTELSYVKGLTSAIQTQLGTKAPTTSPTFVTSITGSYLTASEILITDADKKIVSAAVATYPSLTELTYLKGVTSAIQTQLNAVSSTFKNGGTTKNSADASATQNIAHGLGTTPKRVKITAISGTDGNYPGQNIAITSYNGTTQSSISKWGVSNDFYSDATFSIGEVVSPAGNFSAGVVTWDATNIIITWTKTGNPTGTYNLLWECEI